MRSFEHMPQSNDGRDDDIESANLLPTTQDEGDAPAPAGDDKPTSAAYVKITTTPEGKPHIEVGVPEKEAGRLLETTNLASSIGGTVISPLVMAKTLEMAGTDMPWQIRAT